MTDLAGQNQRAGIGGRMALLATAAVLVAAFVWLVIVRAPATVERAEAEHSMNLPDSTTELQVLGDASHIVWGTLGLDRGASTIFVMDRAELDEFLGQHTWGPAPESQLGGIGPVSQIPANSVYQPSATPWGSSAKPGQVLYSAKPPGDADFIVIELYGLSDTNLETDRVGVWMYSDWN